MKTTILVALFAAAALITGCEDKKAADDDDGKKDKTADKKDKKDAKKDDKGGGDTPKVCQEYFDMFEKCAKNMPAAAKEPMEKGLEATKKALSDAKTPEMKKAQEASCKAGLDALKGNPACK